MFNDQCQLCDEDDPYDLAMFIRGDETIVAHDVCGFDAGLKLA